MLRGVRAKVGEDPWSDAAKLGNFGEHDELVLVDARLLLFGPALIVRTMVAVFRFRAELAHDDRLLRQVPLHGVGILRRACVPADVLIHADDVQRIGEGIVQGGRVP